MFGPAIVLITAWLFVLASAPVLAQPVPYLNVPGGTAWQAGDFADAYSQASTVQTAEAQLLASRAATDQAVFLAADSTEAREWLDLAITSARRSFELEPEGPLAAVALMAEARAAGEAGFHSGTFAKAQLPGTLRSLMERALELDLDNADALVAYSAWHFALTEINVGWLYGADRGQVLPLVERGIEAAPEQLNLRVEYARILFGLGLDAQGREQAGIALELPAVTAADEYEQARARELLASD